MKDASTNEDHNTFFFKCSTQGQIVPFFIYECMYCKFYLFLIVNDLFNKFLMTNNKRIYIRNRMNMFGSA